MKKSPILLCVILWSIYLSAQQDIKLPGIVVEQNSKYRTGSVKYLSNAEVKSAGAAPQRSDDKGQFTLVFADRPGGDVARIFAAKSGYEVVNEEEMKQASVIGRLRPLKIVMCEQGKLYDNQIAYYNIARDASLEAYKRKVAALQKDGIEQQRLMAELRVQFNQDIKTKEEAIALLDKQRQNAEKQAKELADKFVTENLDDQSPAYQRAFAAFEAKNIEGAKAILDSVNLEKRLALNSSEKAKEKILVDNLQKNIAKREEEIRQDVNMCLFKARLHKLGYEWADAERFYELAIAYDEGNYDVVFEVARYMQSQNQFAKARTYYEKALTLAEQPFEKSNILNNLGELLRVTNEMGGAKKAIEEALPIFRKLAENNPDVFLPYVATTLNNLGVLLRATNEMGGAKKAIEEALQLRRQLAEKYPENYLPSVASTLNNLGNLLAAINEMGSAKKAYEEALKLYRLLADKKPDTHFPNVAMTLNNLGVLLKASNEISEAKKVSEEALQIYRKLAEKNPDVYLPDVASILDNLGQLLRATNEMEGAKKVIEEALQLRRQLTEKHPDVYMPDVAISLNNLGQFLQITNEMGGAKQAFEEALQLYRHLADKNPNVYRRGVAMTLNNLGNLLAVINEMGGAKQAFEEASQLYRHLAENNPNVYLPHVASALNNLGNLLQATNELVRAKQAYEEALKINRQLAEKNPEVYLPNVAMTLNNLGLMLQTTNEMGEAKKAFEEALQLYRYLADKNPGVFNLAVVVTDITLGLFYEQLLKNKGEISLKAVGLELTQDAEQRLAIFPDTHPRVQQYRPYIQQLTKFFKEFDEVAFQLEKEMEPIRALETANQTEKDPQRKVQRQQEILGLLSEIEKTMPGNPELAKRIASQYGALAWYQLFTRQFAEAEQSARAGLAKDPGEEWIYTNLALALLYQGKWEAAKEIYLSLKDKKYGKGTYKNTFLADLAELEKAGISHPDAKKVRALLGEK